MGVPVAHRLLQARLRGHPGNLCQNIHGSRIMKNAPIGLISVLRFAAVFIFLSSWFLFPERAKTAEFQFPVHSIDEVADGAIPVVRAISATEAVIEFQSSIPLACSVVFGETRNFGRIAIDDDMDGGAHSDHHPILAGLLPETEYYYRVQGTAADGTIYVGKVRVFSTLALPADTRIDLATITAGARVAAVSSNYGGAQNHEAWGADWAIDGSRQKAWSSAGDGDDAFIEIELPKVTHVGEVSVWTRSMSDGTARILKFVLTTDSGKVLGPFELPDANQPYYFEIDENTRRLRLDVVESTGGNVGLIEFGAFRR